MGLYALDLIDNMIMVVLPLLLLLMVMMMITWEQY